MIKTTGKSKESLRFLIDLKEMKSKTYVATVLGFKVEAAIFWGGGGGGGGRERGIVYFVCFTALWNGSEVSSRTSTNQNVLKISLQFTCPWKIEKCQFPVKSILESSNLAHYPLVKNAKMTQE